MEFALPLPQLRVTIGQNTSKQGDSHYAISWVSYTADKRMLSVWGAIDECHPLARLLRALTLTPYNLSESQSAYPRWTLRPRFRPACPIFAALRRSGWVAGTPQRTRLAGRI